MHTNVPSPSAAPAGPTPQPERSTPRLIAVDFFRGLALIVVLVDHLDWAAGPLLIRRLTPIGLGFSDGAEAFVFLSGLTFGWVYSARLARNGLLHSLPKVLYRSLQIYFGYAITLLLIAAMSLAPVGMTDWTRDALRIGPDQSFGDALGRMLLMEEFPFGINILGLYVVLLPCMLLMLAAARRARWMVLAISIAAYVAIQPPLNWPAASPHWLNTWSFHPLAWQFLFLIGMLIGEHLRRTGSSAPRSAAVAAISAAIVLYGLAYGLRREIAEWNGVPVRAVGQWIDQSQSWLAAKPRLGPFRVVHFLAVAYLAAYCLPGRSRFWSAGSIKPVVNTGRHSLTVYCAGTLMVYAAAVPFYWFGNGPAVVLVVAVDACLLQLALASWLERRRQSRAQREHPPASPPDAVNGP